MIGRGTARSAQPDLHHRQRYRETAFGRSLVVKITELSRRDLVGYDVRMLQKFIVIAAWVSIAMLAYATLAHVGFVYFIYFKVSPFLIHANMRTYAHFEHVIAFAFFGTLVAFAYPKRVIFVCCIIFITAVTLEYLQTLTPDRHGTLIDACEKVLG